MKILVIDDQIELLEVIQEALEDNGYEVQTATCLEQGQHLLKSAQFDLVLCDMVLPQSEGSTSPMSSVIGMRGIRNISTSFPQTPVVAMSGDLSGDALCFTETLGARNTLEKPFNLSELLHKIEDTLIAWA